MIIHLKLIDEMMIASIATIWLGLVRWTYTDACRRIARRKLIWLATIGSVVPVVGVLVYAIVRPPDPLHDVHQHQLEMQALEVRLHKLRAPECPHCGYELRKGFVRCPRCAGRLKSPCPSCRHPVDLEWKLCPFCEADLSTPAIASAPDLSLALAPGTTSSRRRPLPDVQAADLRAAPRRRRRQTEGPAPRERLDAGR
jgi:hypothetical protein